MRKHEQEDVIRHTDRNVTTDETNSTATHSNGPEAGDGKVAPPCTATGISRTWETAKTGCGATGATTIVAAKGTATPPLTDHISGN